MKDIKVIDVLEQAADMSDRLEQMYEEQKTHSGSWPRDKFESWVDSLSEDAQYIVTKFYARNMSE